MKKHKITGQKISQKDKELNGLIKTIKDKDCKTYLEIGAREGNTFYDIMTSLPKGSFGVAVDLPNAAWGKANTNRGLVKVMTELRNLGYDVHMILGDSTTEEVINQVKSFGRFDAILIDGDHRYEGCMKDWNNYAPLANKLVAFHDIDGHGVTQKSNPDLHVEVPKVWEELKEGRSTLEFIDRIDQPHRPMGIGVIIL